MASNNQNLSSGSGIVNRYNGPMLSYADFSDLRNRLFLAGDEAGVATIEKMDSMIQHLNSMAVKSNANKKSMKRCVEFLQTQVWMLRNTVMLRQRDIASMEQIIQDFEKKLADANEKLRTSGRGEEARR